MKTKSRSPDRAQLSETHSDSQDAFKGMKSTDRAAREEILHRAYAIWEGQGHPVDRQLANWVQAESEVIGRG